MATYQIKPGFTFGVNRLQHPETVELTEAEASGFLDKLELVAEVKPQAKKPTTKKKPAAKKTATK